MGGRNTIQLNSNRKVTRRREMNETKWRGWKKVAGESVSRILCPPAVCTAAAAIIPLGLESLRSSSSLPEGLAGRASPPLLFDLAPRGVCHASRVTARAVGSYPTFSPLPSGDRKRWLSRFPSEPSQRCVHTGGLFSVALSVTAI